MNHDIKHCTGHDLMGTTQAPVICSKRETCHRYIAYQELGEKESYQNYMLKPYNCMNDNHYMYWEEKSEHSGDIHDKTDVLPTRE